MEINSLDYSNKKVYIIENGEYKEIPYSDFEERMAANTPSEEEKASGVNPLIERFFILIDDALLEVTHEQYIDYYKDKRRQKYVDEEAEAAGVFFADDLTDSSINGEVIFVDTAPDVCDSVMKQMLIDKMHEALALLPEDERDLIVQIYFENKTERQIASEYRLSQGTIHWRKTKILEKLKQIMNF